MFLAHNSSLQILICKVWMECTESHVDWYAYMAMRNEVEMFLTIRCEYGKWKI